MSINLLPEQLRGKEPEKQKPTREAASFEYKKPDVALEKREEIKPKTDVKSEEKEKPLLTKKPRQFFRFLKTLQRKPKIKPTTLEKSSVEEAEPSFPGISLMPEEVVVSAPLVREKMVLLIAILSVIFLIDFLFLSLVDWRYNQAKAKIANLKTEIVNLEAKTLPLLEKRDEIILLKRKVDKIGGLLDNHIYWSNLFAFLENYTIPEVTLGGFVTDTSGGLVIPAQAKDLISVARQIIVLREAPLVKEVEVSGIGVTDRGVGFQLKLILDPNIFKK